MPVSPARNITALEARHPGALSPIRPASAERAADVPAPDAIRSISQEREIADIIERLVLRHPELPRHQIAEVTRKVYGSFAGARIRLYVPLLAEKEAGELLSRRALDQSRGERSG